MNLSSFYIIPGVYVKEIDDSTLTSPISTSLGAMAFPSRQGPMQVYFETDINEFETLYGQNDFTWTFAHAMIKAFLTVGQGIYLKRVANNALYAGSVCTNDINGIDAGTTQFHPFPVGRSDDYTIGGQQYQNINFAGPLVTGNSVSIIILSDYNDTIHTFTQPFTTDSDTTLIALAAQINTALQTDPFIISDEAVGAAVVTDIDYGDVLGTSNDQSIRLTSPEGTNLTVESITITGGATQTTASVADNPWLFEVWAQNPGIWANDIGYRITEIDQGIPQRCTISFSAPMTAGSQFQISMSLNKQKVTIPSTPFTTDMPTTAAAIANNIANALGEHSEVYVVSGSNGLQIMVISPVDGPGTMVFTVVDVIGGTNPPMVNATQVLTGIASTQTFVMQVYSRANINSPLETHKVSFLKQLDGNGQQLFIEDVMNVSNGTSQYLRVRYNHQNGAATLNGLTTTKIQWLNGGYDGILPSNANIAQAWYDNFSSRRTVPCRLLINGGYSSPVVQQQMDAIAQSRRDCFCILDIPTDSQNATGAVDYRNNVVDINSSYSATYTPDVQITDNNTSTTLYIPPSGHVAAQFAYNDSVAAEWFAPAGLNRGLILNITGLSQSYEEGDMALLIAAQINPIIKEPGKGYQIKSAQTLQAKASALSNINVRRLLITIEISLVEALDYSVYEPNTATTRFLIVQLCTNFLQPIKDGSGLYDYAVVCDSTNNPSYLIDEGQCDVDVYLKPVLPIKFIQLTSVITKTGAYFSEIIAAVEGGRSLTTS